MTTVSVIIPTLNEEMSILATLDAAKRCHGVHEIIVADGGSDDETRNLVRNGGVHLVTAQRGRGSQLHAGACAATGDMLWFLHADTLPPEGAIEEIISATRGTDIVGGSFDVQFDGGSAAARFLTHFYRCWRRLGICYGDSAIFVRAGAYHETGGFKPFPIFEDLDLIRRLKRHGQFAQLKTKVVSSSRRFHGRSFALTFGRWSLLQTLYWCGVHPERLGRMYAPIRLRRSTANAPEFTRMRKSLRTHARSPDH